MLYVDGLTAFLDNKIFVNLQSQIANKIYKGNKEKYIRCKSKVCNNILKK